MAMWVGCFVWAFLMYSDMARILSMGKAKGSPNMAVLVPVFLMFVIYLGTLGGLEWTSHRSAPGDPPSASAGRQAV